MTNTYKNDFNATIGNTVLGEGFMYVWLDTNTGKFSRPFSKEEVEKYLSEKDLAVHVLACVCVCVDSTYARHNDENGPFCNIEKLCASFKRVILTIRVWACKHSFKHLNVSTRSVRATLASSG